MTSAEFRAALASLHWSQRGLAEILGMNDREVRRWATGENAVPGPIAAWLRGLAAHHEANPPPAGPRGLPLDQKTLAK